MPGHPPDYTTTIRPAGHHTAGCTAIVWIGVLVPNDGASRIYRSIQDGAYGTGPTLIPGITIQPAVVAGHDATHVIRENVPASGYHFIPLTSGHVVYVTYSWADAADRDTAERGGAAVRGSLHFE